MSRGHLRMAVMHLPTKFGADIFTQYGVVDVFRNSRWRPPPYWISKLSEFGTFRRVESGVLEVCTKFQISVIVIEIDALTLQTFI